MNRVLVGAQWGDEGKGKVGYHLAEEHEVVARFNGGANAGHTVRLGQDKRVFRMLPTAALHPNVRLVIIGRGVVIDPLILRQEVDLVREVRPDLEIWVDPTASIVTERDKAEDAIHEEIRGIGSTKTGVGPAQANRRTRIGPIYSDLLAQDWADVKVTTEAGNSRLWADNVLACGAHGIMLDPYLGHYPFVTSSPCGPEAVTAGLGLSLRDVDQIVGTV